MGRLIDADDVISLLVNHHFDDDKDNFDLLIHNLCKDIRQIPTSYDVDAVVKQLEELKKVERDREDECDEEGVGDGEQIFSDGRSQGKFEAFGKAIEIVKGGGVYDQS